MRDTAALSRSKQRFNSVKYTSSLTVTPAAFRRSFKSEARVPAGIEGIAVAVDWVEKLSKVPKNKI